MRKLRDEIHAIFADAKCPHCEARWPIGEIHPPPHVEKWQHFAAVKCRECRRQIRWLPFPTTDQEEKQSRRQSRRKLRPRSDSFCEICLREGVDLRHPDTLEVQHVIEKSDGGDDRPENLRIYCTACHSLVNWVRTYVTRRQG